MKGVLINILLLVIIYNITYANGQDGDDNDVEFAELKHLQRKSKRPSLFGGGHGLSPFGIFGSSFGFHAIALLYWLKVKAVIVAFIIGTAIVWGAKYVWGNKCPKEMIHEGPIMPFSHGPLWSGQDHIPYSPSYSYDHHAIDSHSLDSFPSGGFLDSPPPSSISGAEHYAADKKWKRHSRKTRSRQFDSEAQISNIVFAFLGVDSDACRRRFVCEWEFRSKRTPITGLIFRVIGRGIFTEYLRSSNEIRSFDQCAQAHSECRFIEQDVPEQEYEDSNEVNADDENVIVHSHDANLIPTESENENETMITTTELNLSDNNENNENRDNKKKEISESHLNEVQNDQTEINFKKFIENRRIKKKNIIAQTLFNRSDMKKLRVIPIRS